MNKLVKGFSILKRLVSGKGFVSRLLYAALKHFVRVGNTSILYEAYHSKSMTGNPYAIFIELVKDSRFDKYNHVWVLDGTSSTGSWDRSKVRVVKRHSFAHVISLLKAKYLINNISLAPYVFKRKGQIYINTWHGTPMKTLGDDIAGSFGSGSNIARNILHADYLVLPNRYSVDRILSSFNLTELYKGTIIENGHPRIDLSYMTEQDKAGLRNRLGVPASKKVLLYAPTYRGTEENLKEEKGQAVAILEALVIDCGSEYAVLYKGHYFQNGYLHGTGVLCIDDKQDTNQLLAIVDVLITDYSSIAFDFLPLERPIIYFAYDLGSYIEDRGLYIDPREMAGVYCQSIDRVLEEMDRIDDHMIRLASFYTEAREKYCKYDTGPVTPKIVDAIFCGVTDNVNSYQIPNNGKTRILLYGGGYLNNGVTTSLISLLANIDYSKYAVTLISNSDTTGENFQRLIRNVSKNVNIFYVGNSGLRLVQPLFKWFGLKMLSSLFSNEYYTYFADTQFDVAIDYSAYGTYWACFIAFSRSEKKCIYLHNDMKQEQLTRPELADYKLLFNLYKESFDRLITVSKSGYEANCENFPALRPKTFQVDNPIDANRIIQLSNVNDSLWRDYLDDKKINFINISRYSQEKGLDRLIEAFSRVALEYQNLHLYLVGHGLLYKSLKKQIVSLELQEKITLTDNIENPFPLLRACDCFILSSHYEGQGLVLLESMVLDIPCISTDIPGPQSVLSDGKGLLVENSVDGLIYGMKKYLENEVPQTKFNYEEYTDNAMSSFYEAIA